MMNCKEINEQKQGLRKNVSDALGVPIPQRSALSRLFSHYHEPDTRFLVFVKDDTSSKLAVVLHRQRNIYNDCLLTKTEIMGLKSRDNRYFAQYPCDDKGFACITVDNIVDNIGQAYQLVPISDMEPMIKNSLFQKELINAEIMSHAVCKVALSQLLLFESFVNDPVARFRDDSHIWSTLFDDVKKYREQGRGDMKKKVCNQLTTLFRLPLRFALGISVECYGFILHMLPVFCDILTMMHEHCRPKVDPCVDVDEADKELRRNATCNAPLPFKASNEQLMHVFYELVDQVATKRKTVEEQAGFLHRLLSSVLTSSTKAEVEPDIVVRKSKLLPHDGNSFGPRLEIWLENFIACNGLEGPVTEDEKTLQMYRKIMNFAEL